MSLRTCLPLLLAALIACGAPMQNVQSSDAPEWRRRADAVQSKYDDLDKQVDRLLSLLPRASASLDGKQLQRTIQDERLLPGLVRALEKQVGAARDSADGGRYRTIVHCGAGRDEGVYTLSLLRKGAKPKQKGARTILGRGLCPSQLSLDLSAQQLGEGEFRFDVGFEAKAGRPYQFSFELRRLDGDKEEVVCSGGTGFGSTPTVSNSCDVSLKLAAPAELPVAR